MSGWTILSKDWKKELAQLVLSSRTSLIISSPYVTVEGTDFLLSNLSQQSRAEVALRILTDLSPLNICQGSTNPAALKSLAAAVPSFSLLYLPRLHAKVYAADEECAIVTSANLTAGGLSRNYEYGVKIQDRPTVQRIVQDITAYSDLGAAVTLTELDNYCRIAERLRATYAKQLRSVADSVKREFQGELSTAEDELMRLRLAGGAMHAVFAKSIVYLLKRYGPLSTEEIHPKIELIHPDLCDNTVDRVIDDKHFGKKWKHAVRTAQQQLKKKGLIFLSNGCWRLKQE